MAQRDGTPCERPASLLSDERHRRSWPDGKLIDNYHALGPSALSAATLYARTRGPGAGDTH